MKRLFCLLCLLGVCSVSVTAKSPKSLKGPIVVLTFDDATASHAEFVGPLLKKYGFGATFFICEFPGFEDKTMYMTWDQIKGLDDMGFEIGNHGRLHGAMSAMTKDEIRGDIGYIEDKCAEYDIPRPITYAYPGYDTSSTGFEVLREKAYLFARIGGDRPYVPGVQEKHLLPSYSVQGDSDKAFELAKKGLDEARDGQVVLFCFHGVPDIAHAFVSTAPEGFERIVKYMKAMKCKVIPLRDLARYVD